MDEDAQVLPTSGNLFERTSKSPCKGSEFKLYHDVTFGLVKVYMLSLAVHPAVDEGCA